MCSTPSKVKGDLVVRFARTGEKLLALNGREYTLDPEITAIADDNGVQSLGGVMGGEPTSCTEETTEVFIEAALFDPVRTAATGRRLEITSDARYRFERGIDPEFTAPGLEIATRLVLELCGGEPSEVVVAGAVPEWRRQYTLRADAAGAARRPRRTAAGSDDDPRRLGFAVEPNTVTRLAVTPPPWRGDVVGEADLVEEVLRVKGYDEMPPVPLPRETVISRAAIEPRRRRSELVRRTLAARGLTEAVTFSFLPAAQAERFGGGQPVLKLVNPISADLDQMRPSVLPNLLDGGCGATPIAASPMSRSSRSGRSIATTRRRARRNVAGGLRAGRLGPRDWRVKAGEPDLFAAKEDALAALAAAGAPTDNLQVFGEPPAWFHPGRSGVLRLGPTVLAHFGELHPDILDAFDVKGPVAAFEVFVDAVACRAPAARGRCSNFRCFSRSSAISPLSSIATWRPKPCCALRVASNASWSTDIRLFDVYEGKGLPEGKKSLAITVTLQPREATLTDAEIEGFRHRLVAAVEKATNGTLRG